jgi:O-antigen/teichoic acid export membrane protein
MDKGLPLNIATIGKGVSINVVGTLANGILASFISLIVARLFDAETLGIYALAVAIFEFIIFFLSTGLRQGSVRYIALHAGEGRDNLTYGAVVSALKIALISALFMGLMLFFSSPYLAAFFHKPELTIFLRVLALAIPFFSVSTVFLAATRAVLYMQYTVYVRKVLEPGVKLFLTVIFFLLGWRFLGLALSVSISCALGAVLAYRYFRIAFPWFKQNSKYPSSAKQILNFAIPLTLSSFLSFIIFRSDTFLLGYFETSTDVGVYSAIIQVTVWISAIQVSLNVMIGPIVSDLSSREERAKLKELLRVITRWAFSIAFPLFLFVIFFRNEILQFFGDEFVIGAGSLILVSLGQLILAGTGPTELMVLMSGHSKLHLGNNIVLLGIGIPINVVLISKFGVLGASIANLILWATTNLAWLLETYLLLRIHPFSKSLAKPFIAGGFSFMLAFVIRQWFVPTSQLWGNVILVLILGGGYLIFSFAFGLEKEDLLLFHSAKEKLGRELKWGRV